VPLEKVSATFLVDYLAEHSAFPSAGSELKSEEIAGDLSEEWDGPRVVGY
jgi:hypothetical protein